MIFHSSIPVDNPKHVAKVVSEIIGGPVVQFPPAPDAYLVFSQTGGSVGLEFLPRGLVHVPGEEVGNGAAYVMNKKNQASYSGGHLAISTNKTAAELMEIARREGWQCTKCWRATAFPLVEMWLENHYLIEWFPPEFAGTYVNFSTADNWQKYFGMQLVDGIYMLPPISE